MNTDCALIWILVLARILICMDGKKAAAAAGWVGGGGIKCRRAWLRRRRASANRVTKARMKRGRKTRESCFICVPLIAVNAENIRLHLAQRRSSSLF